VAISSNEMVAFLCNRPSMFKTSAGWVKDDSTDCLRNPEDILDYCRKVPLYITSPSFVSGQLGFMLKAPRGISDRATEYVYIAFARSFLLLSNKSSWLLPDAELQT